MTSDNIQNLKQRLKNVDWEICNSRKRCRYSWARFVNVFKTELNFSCPIKEIQTSTRKQPKPRSGKLKNCKTGLDILHTCKLCNPAFKVSYKETKKEYDSILRQEKSENYKYDILESDNKSKTLWKTVEKIKGITTPDTEIPGDPIKIANLFNTFYSHGTKDRTERTQYSQSNHKKNRSEFYIQTTTGD